MARGGGRGLGGRGRGGNSRKVKRFKSSWLDESVDGTVLTPEKISDPGFKTLLASCIFLARSKQFVNPGLGVGVLGQPPGDVVEGEEGAALRG